jgi:two-component system, NtrC family, sensor histidine kinase HydH
LHPFLFSDVLGAVLSVSLGLSVLLRERNRLVPRSFFLFTAGVGALFALAALRSGPGRDLWPAGVLLSLATGWLGIRFFFLLMHGQRRFPHWKGPLAMTTLQVVLAGFFAAGLPGGAAPWQLRLLEGLFLVYCTGWVLADMLRLARRTTHRAALGRVQLLFAATALLALVFPATRVGWAQSPVWHATGNGAVLLYLYFLSQTILHQRLLDLDEMLTRLAVLAGLVAGIAAIYLGMLSWIPAADRDLFRLNVVSASVIVVLLLDPLSQFAERWIFRTLFFRRKELERRLRETALALDVLPASEHAAADQVLESLLESRRVATACLYVLSPGPPELVRLGALGRDFPLHSPQGTWAALWERLQVEDVVTREDVELELERLHRGWLSSAPTFEAQAVLRALDELAADAVFPIVAHERLTGFLAVGDAARKNPYAKSELAGFLRLAQKLGAIFTSLDRQSRMRRQEHLAVLGQLAAGLAHEIRNPLGAIWGAVQVLESPQATALAEEERADFFRIVAQEVHRMNRVVLDFLEYARPAAGGAEPLDLQAACERMLPLLASTAAPVPVRFEPPREGPIKAAMDEDRLRQVLLNLVLNARDAVLERTGTGGTGDAPTEETALAPVVVRLVRREEEALVEVIDEGGGIPDEVITRVFEPFYTTKEKGTGLGLPICARLLEASGGRLEFASNGGRTTATLRWPSAAGHTSAVSRT